MRLVAWALQQASPYRGRLTLLALLSCAEVMLRVLLPWPMKAVVDVALGPQPASAWLARLSGGVDRTALLVTIVVIGLLIQVAHQLVLMLHTRLYSATGHRITRDLQQRLFMHLQSLNLRHHSAAAVGESVYRLERDAGSIEQLLLRGVLPFAVIIIGLLWSQRRELWDEAR